MAGGHLAGNPLWVEPADIETRLGEQGSQGFSNGSRVVDFFDLDYLPCADSAGHYYGTPAGDDFKKVPGFRD